MSSNASPDVSSLSARLRRVPNWAWALLFAIVVCLPRLGSFGFWDPWELKLADQAREIARTGQFADPTAGGKYTRTQPLAFFLEAVGLKLFGVSELGARLFIALAAIGAIMAVYWAGAGLFRRRTALLASLVLGSTTLFVLEARQLTSDAPLIAALALALGGLGRYAWPANGRRRLGDLAVAVAGMALGYLAGGALTGVVLPALSLTAALIVGSGLRPGADEVDDGTAALAAPGVGRDVAAERPFGASTFRPSANGMPIFVALGLGSLVLLLVSLLGNVAGRYSPLLGGVPRGGAPAHTFEALVRQLGFGLFPWSAVAVFALARPLIRLDADGGRTNPRLAFGQLYLFLFAGLGFALSTYLSLVLADIRYVALPAIALAVGAFLDEALEGNRSEPVAGLLMATGTMVVARDFFLAPEELASVHLFDKVKWPQVVSIGYLLLAVGFVAAAGVYTGLATRGRAIGKLPAPDLGGARPWRQRFERLAVESGRWGLQASVACAVLFALYLAHGLVPTLSTHYSFKPVLQSYSKLARQGEKIAKYRVEGHGSGFYGSENIIDVPTQERLVAFLRDPARVFALVNADELAPLDAALKQARAPYYVVDASSSRFLLLTNQLPPGQTDENPLEKFVWMAPTPPASGGWKDGEKPPWAWRVSVRATFGEAIELVGADFPTSVRRPGKIPLDLYFRVLAKPPAGYKIFVHFDGPAAPRVIGDHDPVGKVFPTAYWLPGEYIKDHYETDVPLMTTPAGTYTVFMGFWPGGEGRRLKITAGPNDGSDRVRLGTLEVK